MFAPQTLIVSRPIYSEDRDCGYCHGSKIECHALESYRENRPGTSPIGITIGVSLENISLLDYELLCHRGFRRSGTFLYRPDLLRNCCRMYTIRTNYSMLKLDKDHRKTVNRFMKLLTGNQVTRKGPMDLYTEFQDFESAIDPHVFRTEIVSSKYTDDKFELYKKYQIEIHKDKPDKISQSSFKRFLCDNPFNEKTNEGHVHELYYINDKLLAILVLDILPHSISSVYFIYDPELHKLALGKISSLREINLTRKLNKKWYMLGYYIPDCDKMKYKKKYGGELLDISDNKFCSIDELEKRQFLNNNLFIIGKEQERMERFIDDSHNAESKLITLDDTNIAENLYSYGNENFVQSQRVKDRLIFYKNDPKKLYNLPNVVPGLVPLRQIESNLKNLHHLNITVLNNSGVLDKYVLGRESELDKIVIDLIRILGFRIMTNSVVFY